MKKKTKLTQAIVSLLCIAMLLAMCTGCGDTTTPTSSAEVDTPESAQSVAPELSLIHI